MELLFRLLGVLQNVLCVLLGPVFWTRSKLENHVVLQAIKRPVLMMSATQIAAKIRTGELSCVDVMHEFVFRSRRVNVKLNAVVEERFTAALEEAERVDQLIASKTKSVAELEKETPLLGVPFTVKESCKVKGMSFCVGSKLRSGQKANCDGAAVSSLRKAGAIPILVSTTPEMCLGNETYNLITGTTRNPYDFTRTPGGSSGGEAALLSSAGSVMGVGSDLVGSILCPSMFTSIFGHRPTPKVIPVEGHMPGGDNEDLGNHLTVGPMTRYAEDLPVLSRIMAGDNAPLLRLDEKVDLKTLRVFFMTELQGSLGLPSVDKEIKSAILTAAKHLQKTHGCSVQQLQIREMSDLPETSRAVLFSVKNLPDIYSMTNVPRPKAQLSVYVEFFKSLLGLSIFTYPALMFFLLKTSFDSYPVEKIQSNILQHKVLKKKVVETLRDDGVLLCPVYPTAAPYHHQTLIRLMSTSFCAAVSSLGLPSTCVPAGLNKHGLPIGFQVVAAPYQDRLCFAVAKEMEAALGGWVKPPGLQTPSDKPSSTH